MFLFSNFCKKCVSSFGFFLSFRQYYTTYRRVRGERSMAHIPRAAGEPRSGGYRGVNLPRLRFMRHVPNAAETGASSPILMMTGACPRKISNIFAYSMPRSGEDSSASPLLKPLVMDNAIRPLAPDKPPATALMYRHIVRSSSVAIAAA